MLSSQLRFCSLAPIIALYFGSGRAAYPAVAISPDSIPDTKFRVIVSALEATIQCSMGREAMSHSTPQYPQAAKGSHYLSFLNFRLSEVRLK
jgi:hypothetical protein